MPRFDQRAMVWDTVGDGRAAAEDAWASVRLGYGNGHGRWGLRRLGGHGDEP